MKQVIKPLRPHVVDFETGQYMPATGVEREPTPQDIRQERMGDVSFENAAKQEAKPIEEFKQKEGKK